MTRGVNKVILVGNLGTDPESIVTSGGHTITTIKVATSEKWTDKATNEQKERTEWHRVKLFGKLGEIANEYLAKGRQVYIEGAIRTDKYTDKDGNERYATDIIASEMQMLGTKPEGQALSRSDFNDMSRERGPDAVRAAVDYAQAPRPITGPVPGRRVEQYNDPIPF